MAANPRAIIAKCNGAAFFNGTNGLINLGALGLIASARNRFSVCIWVKRMIEGGIRAPLGDEKLSGAFTGFNFGLNSASRNISNVASATTSVTALGAKSHAVYQWSHMGTSYNGLSNPGVVNYYKNGLIDRSTTLAGGGATSAATGQMRIGNGYGGNRWWNGGLARLMFWADRELSGDDFQEIFNGGDDPSLFSGLTNFWPLETDAIDIIGGNNGTIVGGVTFSSTDVPYSDRVLL